jgi:hypothetical protein
MTSPSRYEPTPATFIFVPSEIKAIFLISFKSASNVEIIISQPFGRQKHSIVPTFGGTLVCLCNTSRLFYTIFLSAQDRCYKIVKVKIGHIMLLIEQSLKVQTLWDLASLNMLLQGYQSEKCKIQLISLLPSWSKVLFYIFPDPVFKNYRNPFPSCALPSHRFPWVPSDILPENFWETQ